jgi:GTP diphosphokinase / guanosine-3',5'-bis(diphosphate) 3'-diphosphatase
MTEQDIARRKTFLAKVAPFVNQEGIEMIYAAYIFAKYGHREQTRDDGSRYFDHPRAVAEIIIDELEINWDWQVVVEALLHDILEDTYLLSHKRMRINFGYEVTTDLKLLAKDPHDARRYYDNIREFGTWRVILIKLADRLHNMRTLENCRKDKQRRKVLETRREFPSLIDLLEDALPNNELNWIVRYLANCIEAECSKHEARLQIKPS